MKVGTSAVKTFLRDETVSFFVTLIDGHLCNLFRFHNFSLIVDITEEQ